MKTSPDDSRTTVENLKREISNFVKARDWEMFHNPKDLGEAIAIEAAELLEHFLWKSPEQTRQYLRQGKSKKAVTQELADLFILLLNFADLYCIDITQAVKSKLRLLQKRYPVRKFRCRSEKYRPLY